MTTTEIEAQKEAAFRGAFSEGTLQIGVSGPISLSVMQWGVDRGYVRAVGDREFNGEERQAAKAVNYDPGDKKMATFRLTSRGIAALLSRRAGGGDDGHG